MSSHSMLYANRILARSTLDCLEQLGESTVTAILRHMDATGVPLTARDLDIRQVEKELRILFGDGAEVLMDHITLQYATRLMLDMKEGDINKLRTLEKIQRYIDSQNMRIE